MEHNILIDRLNRYIDEHELIRRGDKILLTVSGGVDSMVMLHLMASLGYKDRKSVCRDRVSLCV